MPCDVRQLVCDWQSICSSHRGWKKHYQSQQGHLYCLGSSWSPKPGDLRDIWSDKTHPQHFLEMYHRFSPSTLIHFQATFFKSQNSKEDFSSQGSLEEIKESTLCFFFILLNKQGSVSLPYSQTSEGSFRTITHRICIFYWRGGISSLRLDICWTVKKKKWKKKKKKKNNQTKQN